MRYLSVCSGIEAATVAWHPLGWLPAAFAEIDKSASAVLAHHYPDVPNVGDFTEIRGDEFGTVDVLVGGTPCQDFSVAGLRAGMAGKRGQLTVEFAHVAGRHRPRWLVWENVPGVLSVDGGRAFGAFLGILGQLGYGFAYRVLDAQYFGIPQRRRRVFVIGHLGDWRRAAAVLFERACLSGNPPPRREAGQSTSGTISASLGKCGWPEPERIAYGGNNTSGAIDVATAVNACGSASGRMDFESETFVTHSLRADGFDASEDGTGRGTPLVPIAIQERAISQNPNAGPDGAGFRDDGQAYTLEARTVPQAVAFDCKASGRNGFGVGDISPTLRAMGHKDGHANAGGQLAVAIKLRGMAVRRLTPRECERLQGFEDDYTLVPYRGKPMADGSRYKMLGNSMAVPVMRWIGERIQKVELLS